MDNKMRARNYYAAAVSLFQKSSVDDCKRAIELLNEAVVLYPDFFRGFYLSSGGLALSSQVIGL